MTHTPHAPHTGCNHDAEILALRLVLAVARNDWDAQVVIAKQMQQRHNPGVIVKELACIAADFARFLGGDSHAGGVQVVEQWMQLVLDDIDEESK
jgi:hypothetical protein